MSRKLARIATITSLKPIAEADRIECATIDNGWEVVVTKGKHTTSEKVVYLEVDSWVPYSLAPFLTPKNQTPKQYNKVEGNRLRTVRRKGQISQGLVMALGDIDPSYWAVDLQGGKTLRFKDVPWEHGADVTEELSVQKYEPPIPTCLSGKVEGAFPSFIRKTDQERCQNLHDEIFVANYSNLYEVSVKLDGSSCTIFIKDGEVRLCSRNWEIKYNPDNTFWRCAETAGWVDSLKAFYTAQGRNLALQGEVCGPGIQGNNEKLEKPTFFLYDAWDIDNQCYLSPSARALLLYQLKEYSPKSNDMLHVPILDQGKLLEELNVCTLQDLLQYAEGTSYNKEVQREGVVFKSVNADFSFKAISNSWLLKTGK